jgi:CRP-like cAMP-binding protein
VEAVRFRTIEREKWLYGVDDDATGPIAVLSGTLAFDLPVGRNGRFVEWPVQPGYWVGAAAPIVGAKRSANLRAIVTSEVAELPELAWRRIVTAEPKAWRYLGINVVQNSHVTISVAGTLMLRRAEARVAGLLLILSESGFSDGHQRYPIHLPQSEVAYLCGVSRSLLSEYLHDFETRGLVRSGYRVIEVIDAAALLALSERHADPRLG